MNDLTEKQDTFCLEYIRNGGNASEAYRFAYDAENMSDESIHSKAYEVKAVGQVTVRIKELQNKIRKDSENDAIATVLERKINLTNIMRKGSDAEISVSDSINCIKELNKMDGDYAPIKTENHNTSDVIAEIHEGHKRAQDDDDSEAGD